MTEAQQWRTEYPTETGFYWIAIPGEITDSPGRYWRLVCWEFTRPPAEGDAEHNPSGLLCWSPDTVGGQLWAWELEPGSRFLGPVSNPSLPDYPPESHEERHLRGRFGET